MQPIARYRAKSQVKEGEDHDDETRMRGLKSMSTRIATGKTSQGKGLNVKRTRCYRQGYLTTRMTSPYSPAYAKRKDATDQTRWSRSQESTSQHHGHRRLGCRDLCGVSRSKAALASFVWAAIVPSPREGMRPMVALHDGGSTRYR